MKEFIILYKGPTTDMSSMTDEQVRGVMKKWEEWMGNMGESLVSVGNPMAGGVALVDDGTEAEVSDLSGFSIIKASSLDDAKELVKDHPFLSDNDGKFSVEIHELSPAPEM